MAADAGSRDRSGGSVERRTLLREALAAVLAPVIEGCGSGPEAVTPHEAPLTPLATSPLSTLVAAAGVRWVIVAAPKDLLGVAWVPPLVDVAVSGARFDRFAMATGIDLRALPEAVVAACAPAGPSKGGPSAGPGAGALGAPGPTAAPGGVPSAPGGSGAPQNDGGNAGAAGSAAATSPGAALPSAGADPLSPGEGAEAEDDDVMFYLARYAGDAQAIERAYRARFTSAEKRAVERPDVVRVSGKIGRRLHAAVFLGRDVAGFQDGGSASRGPARVATLFAEGKLKHAHSVLAAEPLHGLAMRLGAAPFAAYAPGPFDGDLARGLRGLLGAATAIGAVARPTERQSFQVTVVVTGDFSKSAVPASDELLAAWKDLAGSRLGHMLGLDKPLSAPMTAGAPDAVMIAVELSGRALAEGLAAATASRVQDIFK